MSKKEVKLTMIEKLIVISTFIAATVIIYTACWYVEISEVKEETHNAAEQLYLCNMSTDGDIYNSKFGISQEKNPDKTIYYINTEPIRMSMDRISLVNGGEKLYQKYYYSTELRAQTEFLYFKEDFDNISIDGNVIIICCE